MSVKKRNKVKEKVVGQTVATDMSYNESAGALKHLGPILGKLLIPGQALNAARGYDAGKLLAIYNNSASTVFYKTGPDATVTAPTGISDGAPLPPFAYTTVSLGDDRYIVSNSANAVAFEIEDDSYLQ